MNNIVIARLLLRVGLAFVFVYAAIFMSLSPESYARYIPEYVITVFPSTFFLHLFALYEVLLSVWLLSGVRGSYSAFLAAVTVFILTIVNLDSFNVLFRNVSIFFSAFALVVLEWKKLK